MIDGLSSSSEARPSLAAYRTVARNLPDTTVLMYDRHLRYVLAEGQALPVLGFSTNRVLGHTLREALPTPEADLFEPHYRAALAGLESRIPRQYGSSVYDIRIYPARDDDGVVFAGMVICQDVSAQNQTLANLHASERRNRALLDTIPDYMVVLDREGRIIDQSPVTQRGFRMPNAVVGVNLRDLGLPSVLVRDVFNLIESTLKTGALQTVVVQTDYFEQNGFYELRGMQLTDSHVMIMARALTELYLARNSLQRRVDELSALREIEDKLADTLDVERVLDIGFAAAISVSGARNGGLVLFDDQNRMTIQRVVGLTDTEILHTLFEKKVGIAGRSIKTGQPEFTPDVSKDPDYYAVDTKTVAQITIPLHAHNHQLGLLVLDTDVRGRFTEDTYQIVLLLARRIALALDNALLHDKLKRQHDRISELERLKTEMLKLGAHDLRNPLTIISNYLNLLESDARAAGQDNMLDPIQEIAQATDRIRAIADDILDAERAELMLSGVLMEPLEFNTTLYEAVRALRASADLKRQTYLIEWSSDIMNGRGDAPLISAAATNLVANAIKYTPEGGAIRVVLTRRDKMLYFEVIDNGYGIPEASQALLFEPMHRAKTKETRNIEGTGFGLYLVRLIVQRHGGDVFFTSVYHQGSTFGFWLPIDA